MCSYGRRFTLVPFFTRRVPSGRRNCTSVSCWYRCTLHALALFLARAHALFASPPCCSGVGAFPLAFDPPFFRLLLLTFAFFPLCAPPPWLALSSASLSGRPMVTPAPSSFFLAVLSFWPTTLHCLLSQASSLFRLQGFRSAPPMTVSDCFSQPAALSLPAFPLASARFIFFTAFFSFALLCVGFALLFAFGPILSLAFHLARLCLAGSPAWPVAPARFSQSSSPRPSFSLTCAGTLCLPSHSGCSHPTGLLPGYSFPLSICTSPHPAPSRFRSFPSPLLLLH